MPRLARCSKCHNEYFGWTRAILCNVTGFYCAVWNFLLLRTSFNGMQHCYRKICQLCLVFFFTFSKVLYTNLKYFNQYCWKMYKYFLVTSQQLVTFYNQNFKHIKIFIVTELKFNIEMFLKFRDNQNTMTLNPLLLP